MTTLKRSMKMFGSTLITISVITPASSVFIIAPGVLHEAGTGAFLSFAAAAVVCLFTAFIYAELSSAYPLAGGEYAIIGRVLGPFAGFLALLLNLVTLVLMTTVIALGIGDYTSFIFPSTSPVLIALCSIVVTTLLSILNVRTNAVITGVFLAFELAALGVLVLIGFSHMHRPFSDLLFHPMVLGESGELQPASFNLIGLATAVAIFSYNGYGAAVYFGEETLDASRGVAQAILWSLIVGIAAEAIPITAVLLGAPDLAALFGSNTMLTDFIGQQGGELLTKVVSLGVALAILNANIASILLVGRLLYSSGRDDVWAKSINSALRRIHSRFHSPWVATLLCGILASAACFFPMSALLVTTSSGLVVIYMALSLAVIIARKKGLTGRKGLYRMPFFPLPPIAALAMLGYVIFADMLDPEIGRPSLYVTAAILAGAAFYYAIFLKKRNWSLKDAS